MELEVCDKLCTFFTNNTHVLVTDVPKDTITLKYNMIIVITKNIESIKLLISDHLNLFQDYFGITKCK